MKKKIIVKPSARQKPQSLVEFFWHHLPKKINVRLFFKRMKIMSRELCVFRGFQKVFETEGNKQKS